MIIPWGTDAPIYHRPIATIGMIVVNVLVFVMFPSAPLRGLDPGAGRGPAPAPVGDEQLHARRLFSTGRQHDFPLDLRARRRGEAGLVGLSCWCILGLGVSESAGMQLLVHSETPVHMLGSSGVIFGLLAMCLVWAPMNEVVCIIWLRFTPSVFDVSILWFAPATSRSTFSRRA